MSRKPLSGGDRTDKTGRSSDKTRRSKDNYGHSKDKKTLIFVFTWRIL
ncbi:hypothetical protein AB4Y44_42050 [Paraburkholderia sp. BR10937]